MRSAKGPITFAASKSEGRQDFFASLYPGLRISCLFPIPISLTSVVGLFNHCPGGF